MPHRERRFCFYIIPTQRDENGFIPSLVHENVAGHSPLTGKGLHATPWYWGKTLKEAEAICREQNAKLGLTEDDETEIVASSMRAR